MLFTGGIDMRFVFYILGVICIHLANSRLDMLLRLFNYTLGLFNYTLDRKIATKIISAIKCENPDQTIVYQMIRDNLDINF